MASGVKLSEHPSHVIDAMAMSLLDSDLADYYKLMAHMHIQTKNAEKAKECVEKFVEIALPELKDNTISKNSHIAKELENLDKWKLWIDPSSFPKESKGLIRRKKVDKKVQEDSPRRAKPKYK